MSFLSNQGGGDNGDNPTDIVYRRGSPGSNSRSSAPIKSYLPGTEQLVVVPNQDGDNQAPFEYHTGPPGSKAEEGQVANEPARGRVIIWRDETEEQTRSGRLVQGDLESVLEFSRASHEFIKPSWAEPDDDGVLDEPDDDGVLDEPDDDGVLDETDGDMDTGIDQTVVAGAIPVEPGHGGQPAALAHVHTAIPHEPAPDIGENVQILIAEAEGNIRRVNDEIRALPATACMFPWKEGELPGKTIAQVHYAITVQRDLYPSLKKKRDALLRIRGEAQQERIRAADRIYRNSKPATGVKNRAAIEAARESNVKRDTRIGARLIDAIATCEHCERDLFRFLGPVSADAVVNIPSRSPAPAARPSAHVPANVHGPDTRVVEARVLRSLNPHGGVSVEAAAGHGPAIGQPSSPSSDSTRTNSPASGQPSSPSSDSTRTNSPASGQPSPSLALARSGPVALTRRISVKAAAGRRPAAPGAPPQPGPNLNDNIGARPGPPESVAIDQLPHPSSDWRATTASPPTYPSGAPPQPGPPPPGQPLSPSNDSDVQRNTPNSTRRRLFPRNDAFALVRVNNSKAFSRVVRPPTDFELDESAGVAGDTLPRSLVFKRQRCDPKGTIVSLAGMQTAYHVSRFITYAKYAGGIVDEYSLFAIVKWAGNPTMIDGVDIRFESKFVLDVAPDVYAYAAKFLRRDQNGQWSDQMRTLVNAYEWIVRSPAVVLQYKISNYKDAREAFGMIETAIHLGMIFDKFVAADNDKTTKNPRDDPHTHALRYLGAVLRFHHDQVRLSPSFIDFDRRWVKPMHGETNWKTQFDEETTKLNELSPDRLDLVELAQKFTNNLLVIQRNSGVPGFVRLPPPALGHGTEHTDTTWCKQRLIDRSIPTLYSHLPQPSRESLRQPYAIASASVHINACNDPVHDDAYSSYSACPILPFGACASSISPSVMLGELDGNSSHVHSSLGAYLLDERCVFDVDDRELRVFLSVLMGHERKPTSTKVGQFVIDAMRLYFAFTDVEFRLEENKARVPDEYYARYHQTVCQIRSMCDLLIAFLRKPVDAADVIPILRRHAVRVRARELNDAQLYHPLSVWRNRDLVDRLDSAAFIAQVSWCLDDTNVDQSAISDLWILQKLTQLQYLVGMFAA